MSFSLTPLKFGVVILVVRHREVIRVYVSMFISMLGINFESYGHVLGAPLGFILIFPIFLFFGDFLQVIKWV